MGREPTLANFSRKRGLGAVRLAAADPMIQSRTLLLGSPSSDRAELCREVCHNNLENDEELVAYLYCSVSMRNVSQTVLAWAKAPASAGCKPSNFRA